MDFPSRLLLLLDVVDQGSFVKASEYRNVNKSAISRQISSLESELGVRLLNRTTRSLALTTAGIEIVKQAKILRSLLDETLMRAQIHHSEPRGLLRVTSTNYFGRQYVQKAILAFQASYPDIEIELRLEDRVVDIVGEGYDIGIRTGEPSDSSLILKRLARNRLLIVASPSFLVKYGEPLSIGELEKLPAVVYSAAGLLVDKIKYYDEQESESQIKLNAVYKVNDLEMLTNAAVSGNVISVVTAQMIEQEILEGKLVPIMKQLHLADYGTFYAVYPHKDAPLKTKLFIDHLKLIIGKSIPVWEERIPGFEKMYGVDSPAKS
jgi:DNA-binding transcriptional LysR family regulator